MSGSDEANPRTSLTEDHISKYLSSKAIVEASESAEAQESQRRLNNEESVYNKDNLIYKKMITDTRDKESYRRK